MTAAKPRMLEGIRVIDLTSVVFGPYATQILADMGADVIKVEPPPYGDRFRLAGKPAVTPLMGACHMTLNRGKRSVLLDLKDPQDAAMMRDLLATADVFIHNIREDAIARLGFDYPAVRALRPDIVYVHCMGFGPGGPYSDLQAYDDVIQAASGMTSLPSRVDGDPRPRYVPSTIADKVAGLHGAYAVLGAIIHRLRTGEGQLVQVPMFEAFTSFLLEEHLFGATFDPPTGPIGYGRQLDPHRQPFPTSDGYVTIVPYTDDGIVTLFSVLGAPELLDDPRYADTLARLGHMSEIYAEIARRTPAQSTQYWVDACNAARIPAMAVRDLNDILDDPHLRQTDFFHRRDHPTEGSYREMRAPVRFSAAPDITVRPAPTLGEHNAAIARELAAAKSKDPRP